MIEPGESPQDNADWSLNYFNYFTEVEEHFQRARGTGLFLLSPLDWALIENWRGSGVPLESVLKGIDEAFEKWRSRKRRRTQINSLAYCSQAVLEAANKTPAPRSTANSPADAPFAAGELIAYLTKAIEAIRRRPEHMLQEVADSLANINANIEGHLSQLESLEQRLTTVEDKMVAILRAGQSEDQSLQMREALENELRPYRGKMTADQIAMLERRYFDSALLERANLPRLSLFYVR